MSIFLAKEWLLAAQDDLNLIQAISHRLDLSNLAAFHAQQAVEKSLKSLLEYNAIAIPRKHNLLTLKCIAMPFLKDNFLDDDIFAILNSVYIDSRYPSDLGLLPNGKPSLEDIEELYTFAMTLYTRVCTTVNV